MNHQIYPDSFLLSNIETVSHELSRKYLTKIDLKSANNQIKTDEKFKQVHTINTPVGFT